MALQSTQVNHIDLSQCLECNSRSDNLRLLRTHNNFAHKSIKTVVCYQDDCQQLFEKASDLKSHQEMWHQKQPNYHCPCEQSFPSISKLHKHVGQCYGHYAYAYQLSTTQPQQPTDQAATLSQQPNSLDLDVNSSSSFSSIQSSKLQCIDNYDEDKDEQVRMMEMEHTQSSYTDTPSLLPVDYCCGQEVICPGCNIRLFLNPLQHLNHCVSAQNLLTPPPGWFS